MKKCTPRQIGGEYVCSVCGYGAGKGIEVPFLRECRTERVRPRRVRETASPDDGLILVLGIHRTLSSCLAECLEKLGVYMGANTHGGEDEKLRHFCEEVMPFPTAELRTDRQKCGSYRERPCLRAKWFREWLTFHVKDAGQRPYGAKYPHLCALTGELANVTPLRVINLERPIEESIASLTTRAAKATEPKFQATAEECERLQRFLDERRRAFLAKTPHLTVQAHDLLRYPARELARAIAYLHLSATWKQWTAALRHVSPAKAVHTADVVRPGDWTSQTTVCIKAFERHDCLDRCVRSVRAHYPNVPILVADDSREPCQRDDAMVLPMPYDSGLSAGRNHLLAHVERPYILMLDDDMVLGDESRIEALWDELHWGDYDLVAGRGVTEPPGRRKEFAGHFELSPEDETLYVRKGPVPSSNGAPPRWHTVENIFLARTDRLRLVPWTDELKVGEHIDWCLRAWQTGLKLGYVPHVRVADTAEKTSELYRAARARAGGMLKPFLRQWADQIGFRHLMHKTGISQRDIR